MAVFEEVALTWEGKQYVIPADGMLRAIAKLEDVISIRDLARMRVDGKLKLSLLAQAFGTVLRHAGAEVTDEQVYNGMFRAGGADLAKASWSALMALESMMIPPEHLRAPPEKAAGKPGAAGSRPASSRKPTRSS